MMRLKKTGVYIKEKGRDTRYPDRDETSIGSINKKIVMEFDRTQRSPRKSSMPQTVPKV